MQITQLELELELEAQHANSAYYLLLRLVVAIAKCQRDSFAIILKALLRVQNRQSVFSVKHVMENQTLLHDT